MDAYRNLVAERDSKKGSSANQKKDKLAETKKRVAEVKAALKEARENKKQEKNEERVLTAHDAKMQRIKEHPNSKRAQKDVRHMEHRERRKSGQFCEHGVWKCKICYPVEKAR